MTVFIIIIAIIVLILWAAGVFKKRTGFTTFNQLTEQEDKAALYIMNTDENVEMYYMTNTQGDVLTASAADSQTETNLSVLTLTPAEGGAGLDDEDFQATSMNLMPSVFDPNITTLLRSDRTYPSDLVKILNVRIQSLTKLFKYIAIRMIYIQSQENIPKEDMDEANAYYEMVRLILLGHNNENVESRSDTGFVAGEQVQEGANGAPTTVKTPPTATNANVILANNKSVAPSALIKRFPIVEAFGLWTNRIFYNGRWYRFDVKALKPYENLPVDVSANVFKCSSIASNCTAETLRMCDVLSYALPTQLFDMNALAEDKSEALEATSTYQRCDANTLYGWYVLIYNYIGTIRDDFYNQKYRDYTRTLGGFGKASFPIVSTRTRFKNGRPVTRTTTRWVDPGQRCYHKDVIKVPGLKDPVAYVPKFDISYDRGIGVIPKDMVKPKGCSGDKKKIGAFCYHPNVKASELIYTRGSKMKKGKIRYNSPRTGYKCSGPTCRATASEPNDCPNGYRSTGPQTCERIDKCPSDQEFNAGLCYKKCRDGYKGAATMCVAEKPTATCRLRPDAHRLKDLMCVPRVLNKDRRGKQLYKCPTKRDFRSQVQTYNKELTAYPANPYVSDPPPDESQLNTSDVPPGELPATDIMSSDDFMSQMGITDISAEFPNGITEFEMGEPVFDNSDPFANDAWSMFQNRSGFSAKFAAKFG